MNIYLITLKENGYDEYDSWVVIAKNKEEALRVAECNETKAIRLMPKSFQKRL